MMVIVPLAGPDFVAADGSLKALLPIEGGPLLRRVLSGRAWAPTLRGEDHVFVLIDRSQTRAFATGPLMDWYPGARTVFLSDFTRGAALSALAAAAAHRRNDEPLIVDLADIAYDCRFDPRASFAADPRLGGVALTFRSSDPVYSYLEVDGDGRFVRSVEKKVISDNASAGTYFFASTSVYLRAVAHALEDEEEQTHRGVFFVCPLFNGVRAQGREVRLHGVDDVRDMKILKK